jgi:hypothetical protein
MIHINCFIPILPYDLVFPHFLGVEQTLMHWLFYRRKSKSMMGYIIQKSNKTLR